MYLVCSSLFLGSDSSATYSVNRLRNVSSLKALSNCAASSAESLISSKGGAPCDVCDFISVTRNNFGSRSRAEGVVVVDCG